MLISLGDLGKPFLTWKTYTYKQKAISKSIFKSYMIKKNVNTKSMIIVNSPMKKRKLKKKRKKLTKLIIMVIIEGK